MSLTEHKRKVRSTSTRYLAFRMRKFACLSIRLAGPPPLSLESLFSSPLTVPTEDAGSDRIVLRVLIVHM